LDSQAAQKLFLKYAPCMAYVAVRGRDGSNSIGSAFHVGEGVFVTARHVVENLEIVEVRSTHPLRRPIKEVIPEYTDDAVREIAALLNREPTGPVFQAPLTVSQGPFYLPSDSTIDIAVFATKGLHSGTPHVPLGSHLDDWIYRINFVLSDALIFGYPPIPMTTSPYLVAARAEVNAVAQTRHSSKVQFIVSAMPRGGFSGGLALSEYGFVLGLITESLTSDSAAAELGFMSVLSIEAIYECLAANKLLPMCQRGAWGDFWNTENWDFVVESGGGISELKADVQLHDDGRGVYVGLYCREATAMDHGLAAVQEVVSSEVISLSRSSDMHARVTFEDYDDNTRALARKAVAAACEAMIKVGYTKGPLQGKGPG
jgi:Trypsin-like peptidase domain